MELILQSPWAYSMRQSNLAAAATSPFSSGSGNAVQLPMTPQSAALGPAVQGYSAIHAAERLLCQRLLRQRL